MASIWLPTAAAQAGGVPFAGFVGRRRPNSMPHGRCSYKENLCPRAAVFGSPTSPTSVSCAAPLISLRQQRIMAMISDLAQEMTTRELSYSFRSERGDLVKVVVVGAEGVSFAAHIEVFSSSDDDLVLIYQVARPSSSRSLVEDGKSETSLIGVPFARISFGRYALDLEFAFAKAPFYLSFLLHLSSGDVEIRTHRKTNFRVPVGFGRGYPAPLGVSFSDHGMVNFSLVSRTSEKVILCLYDEKAEVPSLEIELDPYVNRTGNVWHIAVESIEGYASYGYYCKESAERGDAFHAHRALLDPYAKIVRNLLPRQGEPLLLGSLEKETLFNWDGDSHPFLSMEELVVYRLNVEQFTKGKSNGLSGDLAGTFVGVSKKVQHFKELGVNSILLEPIFPFNVEKGCYFPYHFFSVAHQYGEERSAASSSNSMKEMIKALHAEGIEVLMEVVYTHTGEGCQVVSLCGIDSSLCYNVDEGKHGSETNTILKCNNSFVQELIIDSLRYWVIEFHIDGFCFLNSSLMSRGEHGNHLSRPLLMEAIAFDPVLSKTKIIADCWSPLKMSYKEFQVPHWNRWAEMNMRFCNDVRNFLRGNDHLGDFASRLCGSDDLFSSRGPAFSFNFVTKNFGLPLVDLVSFSGANLASELSWNCGAEGPTNTSAVLETRLKQTRNFLFVLFVSLGVPVLNMGDEFGYSTGGSPLYKDRKPIDWTREGTGFSRQIRQFIAFLSSLRVRRKDIFQGKHFLQAEKIVWYGSNQSQPQWHDSMSNFLAVILKSELKSDNSNSSIGDLFICFNASDQPETIVLPEQLDGSVWLRLVDTSLEFPGFFSSSSDTNVHEYQGSSSYELNPHSCALFEAEISTPK
ncbi:isoamylase 2, chloroplastic [Curcuma longa]|uniref:isoamylase 2, chloroplastic n=1 Tax=Curcuma longa TaxID=136217 RepID=UPI003D9DB69D